MSDQHVITDWKAYFAAMGPGTPSPLSRDVQPMFAGPERCSVTFVSGEGLESHDLASGRELLDWARTIWEAEGKPEMWVFINLSGPPWHVPAQPKAQPRKGARAS
jgi:hypothetical protein